MIPPKRRKILALICIYYFSVFITLGRKNAASEWANLRLVSGQKCPPIFFQRQNHGKIMTFLDAS
ncbi:hypothetical protein DX736_00405 [Shigella flexneri]|nr:hypothetical protein [Shigella flexneri]EGK21146.1 hypothetical protein SFVA6_3303 [Shigella flexneri VA-6]EAA2257983.1 hypothetical protein [Shigella flexneri]EAA4547539.1 hypothetical protein [Shigella flexneri]EFP9199405.1 hypothetical protein [Shigella flexneri]